VSKQNEGVSTVVENGIIMKKEEILKLYHGSENGEGDFKTTI
jgi:hypothetical protein